MHARRGFAIGSMTVLVVVVFLGVALYQLFSLSNHPNFDWVRMVLLFVGVPIVGCGIVALVG